MVDEHRVGTGRVVEVRPIAGAQAEEVQAFVVLVEPAVVVVDDPDRDLAVVARVAEVPLGEHRVAGPGEQPQAVHRDRVVAREQIEQPQHPEIDAIEAGARNRDLDPGAAHEHAGGARRAFDP
jgi:hypothetical protein